MENLIRRLQQTYPNEIDRITSNGKAEINIQVAVGVSAEAFGQQLQDHLLETLDRFDIVKINVSDPNGLVGASFAVNQ